MADHDILAELAGYRRELAGLEQRGKTERAEQVRPRIAELEEQVRRRGAAFRRAAAAAAEAGQDVIARQQHAEADRYELAAGPEPVTEQAVPAKPRRRGSESEER